MSILKFIQNPDFTQCSTFSFMGTEAFLEKELKNIFRDKNYQCVEIKITKSVIPQEFKNQLQELGFFAESKCVWLKSELTAAQWKKDLQAELLELVSKYAGPECVIFVQQVKVSKKQLFLETKPFQSYALGYGVNELNSWLKYIAGKNDLKLSQSQMSFLLSLSDDLCQLEQWCQLWSLGGDLWAAKTLGWSDSGNSKTAKVQGSVFDWVDAVVSGNKNRSLKLLNALTQDGIDVYQLSATLAKSCAALACIINNDSLDDFHPFMVKKLKSSVSYKTPRLIKKIADIDVKLKSTSIDKLSMLATL